MRPLRILHLRDSGGLYGAERVILGSSRGLIAMGAEPRIVSILDRSGTGRALIEAAENLGVPTQGIDARNTLDLKAIERTRRVLLTLRSHVVHAHDLRSAVFALRSARGLRVKKVATAHGSTRESWKKRIYLEIFERILLPRFDRVHVVSDPLAEHLKSQGVPPEKIRVIPNGVEESVIRCPAGPNPYRALKGDPTLSAVGRLTEDKGFSVLLQATALLKKDFPSLCLLVAGSGPRESKLLDEVRVLGLENCVHFLGRVDCIAWVYDLSDVLVIPSLREGLPCVLVEAMLAGLPVVATEVGAIPDVLHKGDLGRLVPPADVGALVQGIREVARHLESFRVLAGKARQVARECYTAEVMSVRYRQLYEEVCRG